MSELMLPMYRLLPLVPITRSVNPDASILARTSRGHLCRCSGHRILRSSTLPSNLFLTLDVSRIVGVLLVALRVLDQRLSKGTLPRSTFLARSRRSLLSVPSRRGLSFPYVLFCGIH